MSRNLLSRAFWGLVALGLLALVQAFSTERMQADLRALQSQGPRVAGTPAVSAAGEYLAAELRKAGYTVEFFPFTYSRTRDQGTSLVVGGASFPVNSISGSPGRRVEGPLAVVPGAGLAADFAGLNLQGRIAVVRR
ncbi:MAG: peptidase M28, partial [Meiothermus sp.]|nr:peptidase M28 [Meiothermus sp.]